MNIMNIWDWELLGDSRPDRFEIWYKTHIQKTKEIHGQEIDEEIAAQRLATLYKNPLFWAIASLQEASDFRWHQNLSGNCHFRGRWRLGIQLYYEFCMPTQLAGFEVAIGGEERGIRVQFSCLLFSLWLGIEKIFPAPLLLLISKYGDERYTGISFHNWNVWIKIWRDENGYSEWRGMQFNFSLNPIDILLGKTYSIVRIVEKKQITLCSGKENYIIEAALERVIQRRERLSKSLGTYFRCSFESDRGIPVLESDGEKVYAFVTPAANIQEGVIKLMAKISGKEVINHAS
jgi:hypothetical protein